MKRRIIEPDFVPNHNMNQKRTLPIFDELDQLVNSFSVANRKNQNVFTNNLSSHNFLDNISNLFTNKKENNFNGAEPHQKQIESKSHMINTNRVDINVERNDITKSKKVAQKDFSLDEIDLDAFFESPPVLIKNNDINANPLSQFPLNLIIKHPKLNSVQENCFDLLFNTNHNSLITAPTGSGKTLLFEIAIAKVIKHHFNSNENSFNSKKFKIIYLAPIKSLCQEKSLDWKIKFSQSPLDLKVVEATGDSEYINMAQLSSANIILTTPERFDVLTRKWKECPQFVSSICLLLIDEIHLLNEETRGATIEAIVARMKLLGTLSQFEHRELGTHRLIALSATIPNIPEVAEFLQVDNCGLKIFGDEYRPVKIERIVLGFQKAKNEYMFEKYLDYRVGDLIQKYSEGKPVLVFCQTQKGTINCGKQLINDISSNKISILRINSSQEKLKLESLSVRISNKSLSAMVKLGIGFHNAGLSLSDRQLVEEGFKSQLIKVVCTTSTLAQGVNLPARLVIIKSTNCYRGPKLGYTEYNKMEIDQMVGRAGRPQYDTKGIAIIMTEKEKVNQFNELSSTMIESHLRENIVEHINAEIATGTIIDINSAVNWIKNTFMYVRMKNNPTIFGIKVGFNKKKNELIDDFLKEMCIKIFKDLEENSLISFDPSNNSAHPQSLCRKMSKNYVMFDTMRTIAKMTTNNQVTLTEGANNIEETILDILSNSKEFTKYSSKMEERKTLNTLNKDEPGIKYRLKGTIDTSARKAFILLQSCLSGAIIDHWELRRQRNEIATCSMRILNCLKEYYKHLNNSKGYIACIILKKSLQNEMWGDSELIMKQLPKIGDKLARCFIRAGINSFERLIAENPRKIESICNKNSPFGNILIDIAKSIPVIQISYDIQKTYSAYKIVINVRVPWEKFVQDDFDSYSCYHIVAIESKNDDMKEKGIKFKKKIRPSSSDRTLQFSIPQLSYKDFPINIIILCDKFIGMDQVISISSPTDKRGTVTKGTKSIVQMLNNKRVQSLHEDAINEEDLTKLFEDEFTAAEGKKPKKTRQNKKKEVTKLEDIEDKGNHADLVEMIENMKNESAIKATNLKIKQIKKYEEQSTNVKTVDASTQMLLDRLKDTKTLNLNFDLLDKIDISQNEKKEEKKVKDEKIKSMFNLNLDDIL